MISVDIGVLPKQVIKCACRKCTVMKRSNNRFRLFIIGSSDKLQEAQIMKE
jgi:hypothetical protein